VILSIPEPTVHSMMPIANHDEHAREDITVALKMYLTENVYPSDEAVYENKAKKKFIKNNGREPQNWSEVHHLMMEEPYTKMWSSMARTLQEMLWDNQGDIVEREMPRLKTRAKRNTQVTLGTLTLNPEFKMPRYVDAMDIHAMPGGYQTSVADDDLFEGAVYDRGAYYYSKGMLGRLGESVTRAVLDVLNKLHTDLKPERILDIGCTVGRSTLPLAKTWPDAEVHGIDVGAAILRFGHARAEGLSTAVHFSQQNAEKTNFPDDYFDLVVSTGFFHETSAKGARNIVKEMFRILRPGGVVLNQDIPYGGQYNLHEQFMLNWDCYFNAEPFWQQWTSWDRKEFMSWGGFKPGNIFQFWADRDQDGKIKLRQAAKDKDCSSTRGGLGRLQFFGAVK